MSHVGAATKQHQRCGSACSGSRALKGDAPWQPRRNVSAVTKTLLPTSSRDGAIGRLACRGATNGPQLWAELRRADATASRLCRCASSVAEADTEPAADPESIAAVQEARKQFQAEWDGLLQWLHANGHYEADPQIEEDSLEDDKGAVKRALLHACRPMPQLAAAIPLDLVEGLLQPGPLSDDRKVRAAQQRLAACLSEGRPLDAGRSSEGGFQDVVRLLLSLSLADAAVVAANGPGVYASATPLLKRVAELLANPPADLPPPPAADMAHGDFSEGDDMVPSDRGMRGDARHDTRGERGGRFGGEQGFGDRRGERVRQRGPPPKDGDWLCTECETNNFASRAECFNCGVERSPDARVYLSRGKLGDWRCTSCSFINFASRTECYRCSEPRAEDTEVVGRGSTRGAGPRADRMAGRGRQQGGRGDPRERREGDWECRCGMVNFGWRRECKSCGEAAPAGSGMQQQRGGPRGGRGQEREMKQGDWRCPECNSHNFSYRVQCYRCSAWKEEGGGARWYEGSSEE